MKQYLKLFLFFIFFLITSTVKADAITVTPMLVDMNSSSDRVRNINVVNTGETTAYVQVDFGLIKDPNNLNDLEKSNDPSKLGLLVSPRKLVIPLGQSRLVRIVNLNQKVEKDKFYAIKIAPVSGERKAAKTDTGKKIQVNVQVKIEYLIKVFVRPDHLNANIALTRNGNLLKVTNNGNTNGLLYDGNQCNASKECKEIPGQRIFPGQTWETTLPFDAPMTYSVSYGYKDDKIQSS